MKLLMCLVVVVCAAAAWADSSPQTNHDTEGWSLSKGQVVKNPQGERVVRLDLNVDRGCSGMGNTVALEPDRDYELKIDYTSNNEKSDRDRGSWIYLAFRDAQDKNVAEQFHVFEQSASCQDQRMLVLDASIRSRQLNAPATPLSSTRKSYRS